MPCTCFSAVIFSPQTASCLTPGFVCLSVPPWFHPVTARPLDHRALDLSPCWQSDFWLRRVLHRPPRSGNRQDRTPQRSLF
ncbi:hypothetical protein AMECASPLE_034620 [Ameca splendens]|uniref:Secreted protein n=1 Tax=Ameca splendens TaxID=208324 RepID=A0ABV0ZGU9_9TELE